MAYSARWASLRRTVSHVPSSVERLGTDEKAKITAAQTATGSHTAKTERRAGTAGSDTVEW